MWASAVYYACTPFSLNASLFAGLAYLLVDVSSGRLERYRRCRELGESPSPRGVLLSAHALRLGMDLGVDTCLHWSGNALGN
jgi:hypothetical protein